MPRRIPHRLFIWLLVPALCLLACYDPNPIDTASVSPDGRWLALRTTQGELSLLDLARPEGPLTLYSRAAGRGLAWSPDSRRLLFIEQPPGQSSALWLLAPDSGRAEEPLLRNTDWKADPVWLSDRAIAWLSDAQADHVNVWTMDLQTSATARLFDRPADVSRLWNVPRGDTLIYECAESGVSRLYRWRPDNVEPLPLTQDETTGTSAMHAVACAPDGRAIALTQGPPASPELIWLEPASGRTLARLQMDRPIDGLAALHDGRVAIGGAEELRLWRPHAPWYRREVVRIGWEGLPLKPLAARGDKGLALAAHENILLLTPNAARPGAGRILARHTEDLLYLAAGEARQGHLRPARRVLGDLEAATRKGSRDRFLVQAAWAQIERLAGRWRAADRRLNQAIQAAAPGAREWEAVWRERLALAFFDARDPALTQWLTEQLPGELRALPLPEWLAVLQRTSDAGLSERWMAIGGDLRRERYAEAARNAYALLTADTATSVSLRGLSLLLGGEFEPLGDVGGRAPRELEGMLAQPPFQLALLAVSRTKRPSGPIPQDLRQILLMQWVRQGDLSSARAVMREALADPAESALDYLDLLRQYLTAEEIDRAQQRAITEVLLEQDIAETLAAKLREPAPRLVLRLAQVKDALVEGDTTQARIWLDEARRLLPPAPAAGAEEEGEEDLTGTLLRPAVARELTLIFQAKLRERAGDWAGALADYGASLDLMRERPENWDVAPSEIVFMAGLLQLGAAKDPDLLRSYLAILRGMGDPLISPSREPGAISAALENLRTLRAAAAEPWIQPYLLYAEAISHSQLERPWPSLSYLRRARELNPPPALLQRIVLEEAAQRDTLGEHALAARHYRRLMGMDLPAPLRAAALLSAIQSEKACGSIGSPAARLRELLAGQHLPEPWQAWLRLQVGADIASSQPPR